MKVSEWQSRFNKKFPHKATVELKKSEYRKWQEVPTPAQIKNFIKSEINNAIEEVCMSIPMGAVDEQSMNDLWNMRLKG